MKYFWQLFSFYLKEEEMDMQCRPIIVVLWTYVRTLFNYSTSVRTLPWLNETVEEQQNNNLFSSIKVMADAAAAAVPAAKVRKVSWLWLFMSAIFYCVVCLLLF